MFNEVELHVGTVPALGRSMAVLRLTPKQQARPKLSHTVLVVDCSISMSGSINAVKEDVLKVIAGLEETDYLSIIVFSGPGSSRLIAGPTQATRQGKRLLKQSTDEIKVMNTTVFSEPLQMTFEHLRRVQLSGMAHQAILFTDGVAVPNGSVRTEHTKALTAAKAIASFGALLHIIGYGNHYDKQFAAKLMETSPSGLFRHIADIENFDVVVRDIMQTFSEIDFSDVELQIFPSKGEITGVYRTLPQLATIGYDGMVRTRGLYKGSLTYYMDVSSAFRSADVIATINDHNKKLSPKVKPLDRELQLECTRVTAARLLLNGTASDTSKALDLLRQTGDDGAAEVVAEAYTERDRRIVDDHLRRAFRTKQFIGAGLKPSGPSHCVLNVLRLLMEDNSVVMSLPAGVYRRGGLLTRDPRILSQPMGATVKIVDYTSEKERFNFSFTTVKDVKVLPLDDKGAIDDTLPPENRTVYRTYNIIRDGELILPKFFATMSEFTFGQLQDAGVISDRQKYSAGKSYQLDLSDLKMVSSAWARPSLMQLPALRREEAILEAEQKALNAAIKTREQSTQSDIVVGGAQGEYKRYIEKSTVVKDAPVEYYEAPLVEVRLMKFNPKFTEDLSGLTTAELITRAKGVRKRLRTVRWLARCIEYACHLTGWKTVSWGSPKTVASGKVEKIAYLDEAELKLVTGTTQVAAS